MSFSENVAPRVPVPLRSLLLAWCLWAVQAEGVTPEVVEQLEASPYAEELLGEPVEEAYLAGLAVLHPGRVREIDGGAAEAAAEEEAQREPLVHDFGRGIRYVRVYTAGLAAEAVREARGEPAMIVDLRYLRAEHLGRTRQLMGAIGGPHGLSGANDKRLETRGEAEALLAGAGIPEGPAETGAPREHPVIVLVNGQTAGPFEAVLDRLQAEGTIMAIGRTTAGETGAYARLGGTGYEVLVGEVLGAGGKSLAGAGLEPRIAVDVTPQEDYRAYHSVEAGLPLVNVVDVKLPAVQNAEGSDGAGGGNGPEDALAVRDTTLQRALEVIVSLQVLGRLPR